MKVKPYSKRGGWKDGGMGAVDNTRPVPPKDTTSDKKPTAKNKWYLDKQGMVVVVSIGKFFKQTILARFKEGEGSRDQDALLQIATEDQSLADAKS